MADFPYKPDFKYRVKPAYNVLISKFENQVEQRRLKTSGKLRPWDLIFQNVDKTEMDAVNTFFDNKKGELTSFTIDLDGSEVLGRFGEGSFWSQPVAYQVYHYGFLFQEVIV